MSSLIEQDDMATDDEDMEWEEVDVSTALGVQWNESDGSTAAATSASASGSASPMVSGKNIEITLKSAKGKGKEKEKEAASQKAKQIQATRLSRIRCHKMHTITLLSSASHRNVWLNDPLLHARLLSLVPMQLQLPLSSAPSKRAVPSSAQRGRMFEQAICRLVEWWIAWFNVDDVGIRRWGYEEVRRVLELYPPRQVKGKSKAQSWLVSISSLDQPAITLPEAVLDLLSTEPPLASGPKSLAKHLLMRRGSRDVSALLFTALCRALGVPARLVVSLQSVGWWGEKPKAKRKPKGGKKDVNDNEEDGGAGEVDDAEDDDMEEVDIPGPSSSTSAPVKDAKVKGKPREVFSGDGVRMDGGFIPPKQDKSKGKEKAKPVIKLRKSRGGGRKLNESLPPPQSTTPVSLSRHPNPRTSPPIFWTEVFSRPDGVWIPVDPIRGHVNKRRLFDPEYEVEKKVGRAKREEGNRMVYVVGFEEDGFARDVTPRYASNFLSRVSLIQGAAATSETGASGSSAAERRRWWERVMGLVKRPYVLNRDVVEDEMFRELLKHEGMPSSVAGFKGHELYVLERHLKQTETIYPLDEVGRFRGDPVYPRANVVEIKTAENWMRRGRAVREGEQPLKSVKLRASTIARRREMEVFGGGGGIGKGKEKEDIGERLEIEIDGEIPGQRAGAEEGIMQGLYAESQTELYRPAPVVDGRIPKNDFGNIDLYVPSMLPEGAVHIPFKGAAKIARILGFDYAEAVTGFEFRNRRATPIITGVVVAAENESALLEAYWETERDAEEKRRVKRHEQVLKRWTRLIQGLRIRDRLKKQYAGDAAASASSSAKPAGGDDTKDEEQLQREAFVEPGGYLMAVDDILQPFTLPKYQHVAFQSVGPSRRASPGPSDAQDADNAELSVSADVLPLTIETIGDDADEDMEKVPVPELVVSGTPKTMRELAEASVMDGKEGAAEDDEAYNAVPSSSTPVVNGTRKRSTVTSRESVRATQSTHGKEGASTRNGRRKRASSGSEVEATDPSPAKRARSRKTFAPAVSSSPVKSDRVLRTRKNKSAAEVDEENGRERAYRLAVAE